MERTIEQIEGVCEAPIDATPLVRRCTELRRKPLPEFTVEDLRIMLGQEMAVPILLPMAVNVLVDDPLAAGDFYAGDLLKNVMELPASAWTGAADRARLVEALRAADLFEASKPLRRAVAAFVDGSGGTS